jgi:hypothetical protein
MNKQFLAYNKDGKLIYITNNDKENEIHFVPIIRADMYMEKRKTVPKLAKFFNTIKETYDAIDELEKIPHIFSHYTPKKKEYVQLRMFK